jgi:hypothetical protein
MEFLAGLLIGAAAAIVVYLNRKTVEAKLRVEVATLEAKLKVAVSKLESAASSEVSKVVADVVADLKKL